MSFSIFSQVDPSLTMNYLILGYGVMWLICALYVANLASRQRNLRLIQAFRSSICLFDLGAQSTQATNSTQVARPNAAKQKRMAHHPLLFSTSKNRSEQRRIAPKNPCKTRLAGASVARAIGFSSPLFFTHLSYQLKLAT